MMYIKFQLMEKVESSNRIDRLYRFGSYNNISFSTFHGFRYRKYYNI